MASPENAEPLFAYGRCARLANLPQGATVTCAAVHTKFLVRRESHVARCTHHARN